MALLPQHFCIVAVTLSLDAVIMHAAPFVTDCGRLSGVERKQVGRLGVDIVID